MHAKLFYVYMKDFILVEKLSTTLARVSADD